MKIEHRDERLFTSIKISYNGSSKILNNVIIDTGASDSVISSDVVEDIGINTESENPQGKNGELVHNNQNAFKKKIDEVKLGAKSINNVEIKFDKIESEDEVSGLLGLDILMKAGAVIDLENLNIDFE